MDVGFPAALREAGEFGWEAFEVVALGHVPRTIGPWRFLFWESSTMISTHILTQYPYAPCIEYIATFGTFIRSMLVNIPYMEHVG